MRLPALVCGTVVRRGPRDCLLSFTSKAWANVFTHAALINASEKGRDTVKAMGLPPEMQRRGLALDVITYNVITSACEKGRHTE